jgi:sigma-B regulation protein RsbU (phosphoserine phosphatase)
MYEGTRRIKEGDFSHRIAVQGNDQLSELAQSFNSMTETVERLIVVEKERERMQSELEIAREVQNQLFPKSVPEVAGLQIAGACNPARMVSGDYYDFMLLADGSLAVAIGDVAGKGISAALLMSAIQFTMRTHLSTRMPVAVAAGNGGVQPLFSTAHLVSQLNQQLFANTSPEKFATFCFGVFDESTGLFSYTNAGHPPPMLLRNGTPEQLSVTGTVVGAFPFSRYEEKSVALRSEDVLCAYTDGIVEPENVYGEQFGEERLADLLVKYRHSDTQEIIARTMENVQNWTGSSELQDDMTMVVIRKT